MLAMAQPAFVNALALTVAAFRGGSDSNFIDQDASNLARPLSSPPGERGKPSVVQ